MDIIKGLSDSIGLVMALVQDVEAAIKSGGGIVAEGIDLVEVVMKDEKVKASFSALIQDIKG